MARIWHGPSPEAAWIAAANGDRLALSHAFVWSSTKEGQQWWSLEHAMGFSAAEEQKKMPQHLKDRIATMYVEWKLIGDWDEWQDDKDH